MPDQDNTNAQDTPLTHPNEDPIIKDVEVEDGDGEEDISEQTPPARGPHWFGAGLYVEDLVERFENDEISFPDFQRLFVWNKKQASRLIESILLNLPIPSIYIYLPADKRKPFIIDGLQRLMTLSAFKKGSWPDSDPNSRFDTAQNANTTPFILTGLSETSPFLGKDYTALD